MPEGGVVDFDSFSESWLEDVRRDNPSTVELGRRFALKLISQWLDMSDIIPDLIYCDGSRDGGIDIAFLDTGPDEAIDDSASSGHTWYLVQSKYGAAFAGAGTLLIEGQKVIDTIDGRRTRLNSLAEGVLERLNNFRNSAGASDRIVLVYATSSPLTSDEKRTLDDLRAMGSNRLGALFDVEAISIETIYARLQEVEIINEAKKLEVDLGGYLVPSGPDLLVGSVGLLSLYEFLKSYRNVTGDLDRIYEKNVRRFLGGRGKVNKAMHATLRDAPERFGLYNNGITIVVQEYQLGDKVVKLVEPFVVNGCQTTRTIWNVFHAKLSSGGRGVNPEIEAWRDRAAQGVVVAKIAKVGEAGETLLQAITRYTNSQNAIKEKDFLALTSDFKNWQVQLAHAYGVYLEIQRGGWDSQKALQNTNQNSKQFSKHANAADLVKIYGAGWLGEVGLAFGKNPPFLPDGSVFKRIVNEAENDGGPFGAVDLYAAYLLQQATIAMGFGRGAEKASRRQTRYIFAMAVIDLLKDVLSRANRPLSLRSISENLVKALGVDEARNLLLEHAAEVVDGYLTQGSDDSVFLEPAYLNSFNSDLNAFLKWEKLGKTETDTPRLRNALAVNKAVMGRTIGGINARDAILRAIGDL